MLPWCFRKKGVRETSGVCCCIVAFNLVSSFLARNRAHWKQTRKSFWLIFLLRSATVQGAPNKKRNLELGRSNQKYLPNCTAGKLPLNPSELATVQPTKVIAVATWRLPFGTACLQLQNSTREPGNVAQLRFLEEGKIFRRWWVLFCCCGAWQPSPTDV